MPGARQRLPVIALLTGNAISLAGSAAALVAIPWFVLQTTHSPAKAGITGFFITLATVTAAFFGGGLVDRLGFKRTSIAADVASGVAVAIIPLLYVTVGLQYWELLVLVFVGNLLDAPGNTARDALIPELAEQAGMSLEQAGAAIQAAERGARMVGAPLAGRRRHAKCAVVRCGHLYRLGPHCGPGGPAGAGAGRHHPGRSRWPPLLPGRA